MKIVLMPDITKISSRKKATSPIDLFYELLIKNSLKLFDHLFDVKTSPFRVDVTKVYVSEQAYQALKESYKSWLVKVHKEPKKVLDLSLGMAELQMFPCKIDRKSKNYEAFHKLKDDEVALEEGWLVKKEDGFL